MTLNEFSEEVFSPIYNGSSNQPISPTQLALLFIALGTIWIQLTKELY